jgi:hypothetical protein
MIFALDEMPLFMRMVTTMSCKFCQDCTKYQMPYGNVIRVGGGCGPLYLNGQEADCLLCQWGGCAPYWGPRGVLIHYINMLKK